MKKSNLLILLFLCFLISGASAQFLYGPKLGLNLANQSGDIQNNKMLIAFNVGAVGHYTITDMIGVQAELLFDKKGTKYEMKDIDGNTETVPASLSYLNIPLLGVANFDVDGIQVFAEFGPTIGILLGAKYDGESEYEMPVYDPQQPWLPPTIEKVKYKDWYKGTDIGLAVGAGAGIPVSTVVCRADLRYNFGLGTIHAEPDSDSGEEQQTIRNGVLSLNVIVLFGGPGAAVN